MECPLSCCSQDRADPEGCDHCDNNHDVSVSLINLSKSLMQKRNEKEIQIEKLKAMIAIADQKLKTICKDDIPYEDSFTPEKGVSLSEYFSSLTLPQDLFSIVTREDLTVGFMVQSKFIPSILNCPGCANEAHIVYYTYSGYIYFCTVCKSRNKLKSITFFQNSPLSLEKILLFVFLWVLGLRDQEISSLLESPKGYISSTSRKMRQMVGKEFMQTPPVFSGVVEIDQMDFIKRKIEIGKSKAIKKWVLLIVERGTRQMYIEHIPERKKEIIVPIIQRMCLPGTVIITKEWGGYGRLEDLGFCHYRYCRAQGFTDPNNSNIHHSNVKIAFTWLKYQIKTKNRTATHLQEFILEWLWRKRNSLKSKCDSSVILVFKATLIMLSKLNKN